MNQSLLKEIVSHVMANFGVIPSTHVNHERTNSLMEPAYLLPEKIVFDVEGTKHKGKVWGCQMSVAQTEIKVLLGDCTLDPEFPEFAMVIKPSSNVCYGLYLCYNQLSTHPGDSQPDLCVSMDGQNWMECNAFLQGTFLAAVEQSRELRFGWYKVGDHKSAYEALLSFMNFHDSRFGD